MRELVVAIDVDGVIADLQTEWIRQYNRDYQDNLKSSDITDWYITKFVKPECGNKMLDYLANPDMYDYVDPIEGAKEGIDYIRSKGHKVIFASSCVFGSFDQKVKWVMRKGFMTKEEKRDPMKVFYAAGNKSRILADVLIDDYIKNVVEYPRMAVLFSADHNAKESWTFRMDNWNDKDKIDDLLNLASGEEAIWTTAQ